MTTSVIQQGLPKDYVVHMSHNQNPVLKWSTQKALPFEVDGRDCLLLCPMFGI